MAGTIDTDLTLIENAEVTGDYLVLGTFATARALNDDIKVEGTNAINGRVSNNTAWALAATPSANLNLTGTDIHIYSWLRTLTWPSMDTRANGGLGVSVSSDASPTLTGTTPSNGPTNSKTWYLAGSDTDTTAGWVCYVVDPNGTPDLTLGTPDISSVDRIGLRAKVVGTVSNKTLNIQDDVIRYGTGLTFTGGTTGSPGTLSELFAYDSNTTRAWGIVTRNGGIYSLAGKIRIGTTPQTSATVFADASQVAIFPNYPVTSTLYEIKLTGNATYNTTLQLGLFTNNLASDGLIIRGSGTTSTSAHSVWNLNANEDNTICKLYGCTLSELRRASFNSSSQIYSCSISNFGNISGGGADFDDCVFQALKKTSPITATYAVEVSGSATTLTNCKFVNCNTAVLWNSSSNTNSRLDGCEFISGGTGHAIELGPNTTSPITLTEVVFTGYGSTGTTNAAIYNNSGKGIVINIVDGSTPSYYNGVGASTSASNNINITLTGLQNPSEVRVFAQGTTTELVGTGDENVTDGDHAFSVSAGQAVDISVLSLGYQNLRILNYSSLVSASIPVSQVLDRQYLNP